MADLTDAYHYLETRNARAAERLFDDVEAAISRLRDFPLTGAPRDELRPNVRIIVLRRWNYGMYYRAQDDVVTLLRLLHTSRDLTALSLEG